MNPASKLLAYSMIAMSTLASCKRKPLVKMPAECITKEIRSEINAYRKSAEEVLKDSSYVSYGKDTLLFDKDFQARMKSYAKHNNEQVVVSRTMKTVPMYSGKSLRYVPQLIEKKEDKFLSAKALVKDTTLFTTDSTNIFVPVEYYGIPNPKAIPKH